MARRALFLGSKAFGLAILRTLVEAAPEVEWQVVHPDDSADGRTALGEFEAYCRERGLPLTIVDRASAANALIVASAADVVMVCGWHFLLPPAVLDSGPRFLGIHNSLLPKYRGGAPLVWAMINGEAKVGSSLFGFTPGMDDGPIYLQVSVEPAADDTIGDVLSALEQRFVAELSRAWRRIATVDGGGGKSRTTPQPPIVHRGVLAMVESTGRSRPREFTTSFAPSPGPIPELLPWRGRGQSISGERACSGPLITGPRDKFYRGRATAC